MAIIIHGRLAIRSEMLEEVRAAAVQLAKTSRAEPRCNEFLFTRDLADPTVMVLTEEWASEEALQAHFATPYFRSFSKLLEGAIAAPPELRRFDAQDSRPLFD
jgi:quinol monooxygenase YgiN